MQPTRLFSLGALLMVVIGCTPTPVADNNQRREEATQATQQATPASDASDPMVNGEEDGASSLPFIAEARSRFTVINLLSSGRLEVIDGCLTVKLREEEPATAVFPPGAKPEIKGNDLVAVSFEGQRIPVGQDTRIPGGGVRLESGDLVKPVPSHCPKTLFGLGG